MKEQLYFEDVEVGMEIPALTKRSSPRQLVKWASAAGDWYEIHYDKDFAQSTGLPGLIVHGWLSFSYMSQMVCNWIGDWGTVKRLSCSFRGMNYPDEDIICKGKVVKKYVENGEHLVDIEATDDNQDGERCRDCKATVRLISRSD